MNVMDAVRTDLPNLKTSLPGPKAQAIIDRDNKVISPSYTRGYPLVAARGEGAIIEDVDGNRFLDFNAGIAVVSTGHCHPKVVASIQAQAAKLIRQISSLERELTMSLMTNASYANISDLLTERVTSEQYIVRGKITFLFTMMPFLQKKKRETADEMLTELYNVYRRLPGN